MTNDEFSGLMGKRKEEWDALEEATKQNNRLRQTAPVDDDFPQVLSHYEASMRRLARAMKDMGRSI
jgi:hypothetical protein